MKKFLRRTIILIILVCIFLLIQKHTTRLDTFTKTGTTQTGIVDTGNDLMDCMSYFDGCNTCSVSSGMIAGCTKMFCQKQAEPKCLEYRSTGIDLTNCVSYFDGCNNCSIKDGKPEMCTLMYCETPTEPKCLQYTTGAEQTAPEQIGETTQTTIISNNQWFITQVYTEGSKRYLKIDYTENGPQGPGGAPEIINNNPLIRIFEIADTATFEILKNLPDQWAVSTVISRDEFMTRGNSSRTEINPDNMNPDYYWAGKTSIVQIAHDSQKVYKVTETYRP